MTANKKDKPKQSFNFLMIGSGQMYASMIISGFIVGYFIDYLAGTTPIFMLLCGLLGIIGGTQKVQRMMSQMDKAEQNRKETDAG
ncbi:AtpZ/AtpI family protein [Thiomicrospira microaerophila]|uniref:AtpZ/AtpI family protein n=1 Tax=Thiomicrospira microaerophila TaxID=406020 RepID=UPI00200BFB36|nr:AtpZ/AtpI family protein [Thiomicrospira microaerophila]UQB42161.1 AtpZ/AtpI family protein [Thiomicrospira microaerophila]